MNKFKIDTTARPFEYKVREDRMSTSSMAPPRNKVYNGEQLDTD
jgi:hypothetical protein